MWPCSAHLQCRGWVERHTSLASLAVSDSYSLSECPLVPHCTDCGRHPSLRLFALLFLILHKYYFLCSKICVRDMQWSLSLSLVAFCLKGMLITGLKRRINLRRMATVIGILMPSQVNKLPLQILRRSCQRPVMNSSSVSWVSHLYSLFHQREKSIEIISWDI